MKTEDFNVVGEIGTAVTRHELSTKKMGAHRGINYNNHESVSYGKGKIDLYL